jgi:TonB dependent receptor
VNLQTRQGGDHPEGSAQLRYGSFDTIEPGVTYSTSSGKVGMFVGGSYLYSQRALDPPSIDPILHDTGASGRVFTRLDWAPCTCNRYELFATYAHNRFQVPLDPAATPFDAAHPRPVDQFGNAAPSFIPRDTNASETEDEAFIAMSFTHTFEDGNGKLMLAPLYKLSRGVLFSDAEHALGETADPGATASDVTRTAQHAGGVATYTLQSGGHVFKTGAQTDFLIGSTNFVAYTRDDATGMLDPTQTARGTDHTDALQSGVYAQDRWTSGAFVAELGLRLDELHVILHGGATDDSAGISPRLGASYSLSKNTVLHAFTGINWQPPSPLDAADAARALGVVPANQQVTYDLKPETDFYSELGVTTRLASPLRGGLIAWGRYAWNQLDDTAIGSTSLLSNYNFERGRAGGLEGSLDMRVGPWLSGFANISYGFAQGEGISSAKFLFSAADLANTGWQTLDHAQTLTANAGATLRDGRFTLSGTVGYGSGLRTGPDNNAHVPGHVVTDLSAQYTFLPRAYPVRVGIDVVNLFDEQYAFRIANGFVGSSYGAPRSVFVTLSIPLAAEPHHEGEGGVK